MPAGIRIADTNDGVDVRVGLFNNLGQVLDRHLRVVTVDLLDGERDGCGVYAARPERVSGAAVTRLHPQPVGRLLAAQEDEAEVLQREVANIGNELKTYLPRQNGSPPPPPPDDFIRGNIVHLTHHIKLPSLTE